MVKNIKNDHETLTEIFAIDYDTNKIDKCVIQGGAWLDHIVEKMVL